MVTETTAAVPVLHLFEGFGIEIEYMIVDAQTLAVCPITDKILHDIAGSYVMEVERGAIAWSNELALHVIELKTNGPAPQLTPLPTLFQQNVQEINQRLQHYGARLMPSAMHPWMNPHTETQLWPHEDSPIYNAFDQVFGCQGHGWSNLQSVHINLPFANDAEFARLHAAIRLILPILPALAASSPLMDGKRAGHMDARLDVYRSNAKRVPSVSGKVIPEPVYSRQDYETQILEMIYRDLQPHDPHGVLRHEWVNARGAIARFDRNAIEIRVLDVQECPAADLALVAAIVAVIRLLVEQHWVDLDHQKDWEIAPLQQILLAAIEQAENAVIGDRRYLDLFAYPERGSARAGDLWQHLFETVASADNNLQAQWGGYWQTYIQQGTLASRIVRGLEGSGRESIQPVFTRLCDCLQNGTSFVV